MVRYFTVLLVFSLGIIGKMSSQNVREYLVDIGNFNEIKVKNSINVDYIYATDSIGTAQFMADSGTADAIVFENKKGKLTISLQPRTFNRDHTVPTVVVRSNSLISVVNEGDSLVRVLTPSPVAEFKARLTGNGTISVRDIKATDVNASISFGNGTVSISGKTNNLNIKNTGTGAIQCGLLQANKVKCNLMGTGNIDCIADEELVITGVGSGTVYYAGELKELRNRGLGIKTVAVDSRK